MKKTLKRTTYKLNKNRKLTKETKKNKFKKQRNIKKNRKTQKKRKYSKKSQKGGFIQLPFMNNSEGVLVNAMCNQLDETELVNNPRKIDGFVNSLCNNKKNFSGGAESNEGGVIGIVKNITSLATAPLRTIINVLTGGSKQPAPIVTQPQVNIQPVPIVTQPMMSNFNHNTQVKPTHIKKKNTIAKVSGNTKIQTAGSVKKKKIKLPKL